MLREDKNYAEFFKETCLENMMLMEHIFEDDQQYVSAMISAKESKRRYRAKIDELCISLKKRLHRHDSDLEDEQGHYSWNGFKI